MASRAIPSHLKPSAAEGGEGGFSSQRHHGKSQSHVVSTLSLCFCSCPACVLLFPALLACIGFVAAQRTQLSSPLPVVSTWVWWGPRRAGIELATIAGRSQFAARPEVKAISYERTRRSIRVGVRSRSRVLAPHSHRLLRGSDVVVTTRTVSTTSTPRNRIQSTNDDFAGFREHIHQCRRLANAQCAQQARRHRHRPR